MGNAEQIEAGTRQLGGPDLQFEDHREEKRRWKRHGEEQNRNRKPKSPQSRGAQVGNDQPTDDKNQRYHL